MEVGSMVKVQEDLLQKTSATVATNSDTGKFRVLNDSKLVF